MLQTQRRPIYKRWWFWVLAGIFMFLFGYLVGLSFTPQGRINPLELLLISDAHPGSVTDLHASDTLA